MNGEPLPQGIIASNFQHKVIIGVCILLSIVDMLLLSQAVEALLDVDQGSASITALALTLVGTASAFFWGRAQATHKERRMYAHFEPWIWILIGLLFVAIRIVVVYMGISDTPEDAYAIIAGGALQAFALTILYVAGGLTVRYEASRLYDPNLYLEHRSTQSAKSVQKRIANRYGEAERLLIELENFQKYYDSLQKQYRVRKDSLIDAEHSTLNSVVKRVLEDNARVSPQVVDDILRSLINERKNRLVK